MVKAAIEGLTLSLRREVTPFGITAMTVEAGGFRTDLAGRSLVQPETHLTCGDAPRRTPRNHLKPLWQCGAASAGSEYQASPPT